MAHRRVVSCLIALLAATACSRGEFDRDKEERAVLGAIFDNVMRMPGDDGAPIVLEGRFVRPPQLFTGDSGSPPDSVVRAFVARLVSDSVPRALARELARVSVTGDSVSLPFPTQRKVVLDTVLTFGPPSPRSETVRRVQRFQQTYASFPTLFGVSHVAFSRDGRTAAVYVESYCGPLCAGGDVTILERTTGGWRVKRVITLWVS